MKSDIPNHSSSKRLETLIATGLMDSPIEAAFDRLTHLAVTTLNCPVSLISLVDENRQFFKSMFGLTEPWLSARETPLTHSFCKHVVGSKSPLIISDARTHSLVSNNPAIQDLNVIAYLGIPICMRNGEVLGSFCVIDNKPRTWTEKEIKFLSELCFSVVAEIELRLVIRIRDELIDLMTHDVKNPLAAILMISEVMLRKDSNFIAKSGKETFEKIKFSCRRIEKLIDGFGDLAKIESGTLKIESSPFVIDTMIQSAIKTFLDQTKKTSDRIDLQLDCVQTLKGDFDRLKSVFITLLEIFNDSIQEGLKIKVESHFYQESAFIRFTQDQLLVEPDDVVHFFDRFWTSQLPARKGKRLSLFLAHQIIEAHQGKISVLSNDKQGTQISIILPC